MNIKLIAIDMDGTLLNDQKEYDRPRFAAQYTALQQQGVELVIASGNQYYQLISFFPQLHQKMSFIAENGALIYDRNEQIYHAELSRQQYHTVLSELAACDMKNFVVCGLHSAWYQMPVPQAFINLMAQHYHRLQGISQLEEIDDIIFKFSLNLPDNEIPALIQRLHHTLDGIIHPVVSGYGFIDLIIPGSHKASGLQRLMVRRGIDQHACIAIGDGGNDLEMLQLVDYSFAMANASVAAKSAARYTTDSNNDSGVLQVLDALLQKTYPFIDG